MRLGIDPMTHKPLPNLNHLLNNLPHPNKLLLFPNNNNNNQIISPLESALRLQANLNQIANIQLLQNIVQILNYNNNNNPLPLVQNNNVPMVLYNNVTTFDNFNVGSNEPHLFDHPLSTTPTSHSVESVLLNQPSPMSNSLEIMPDNGDLVPRVLMSDVPSGDDGILQHSSLPPLVSETPETSNSDQMFPRGVMPCGGENDDDFSAWEKDLYDEGNTSFWESIFQ